jgi:hypothetical protein
MIGVTFPHMLRNTSADQGKRGVLTLRGLG